VAESKPTLLLQDGVTEGFLMARCLRVGVGFRQNAARPEAGREEGSGSSRWCDETAAGEELLTES
jgi:hypothetical protein